MYVNRSQVIQYTAELGLSYTATSAAMHVLRPDGRTDSDVVVTLPSTQPSDPQTVMALYTPTLGGLYTLTFDMTTSLGQFKFPTQQWVTWTDVYSTVRGNLNLTAAELPDALIDDAMISLVTEVTQYAPAIGSYTQLVPASQLVFDRAMKWLLSSRMRAWLPKKAALGELVSFRKGSTSLSYAGRAEKPSSPEKIWWEQGWQILMGVPEIAAAWDNNAVNENSIVATRGNLDPSNYLTGYGSNTSSGSGEFNAN